MTLITVCSDRNGSYSGFACHGHADYADSGEDIVCAGISALVINTVNCLQDILEIPVSVVYDDDGNIECSLPGPADEKAALLIDSMVHGLEWIRIQYGDEYLRIEQRSLS